MARIFMTGFEDGGFGGFTVIAGSPVVNTTKPRTGTYALSFTDGARCRAELPSALSEFYLRFGLAWTSSDRGFFMYFAGADTNPILLFSALGNTLRVLRGNHDAPTIALGGTIPSGTMACVEMYVKLNNTTGRLVAKIDGAQVIDFTGDTQASDTFNTAAFLYTGYYHYGAAGYLDDIAINDTTGSVNNSWIGGGGIRLMPVNGAGVHTALTPSVGSNYQCVDEVPPNDADYVSTTISKDSDADQYDLYTLSNAALPASGTVSAACLFVRAQAVDGITPLVPLVHSNETLVELPRRYLPQGYSRSDSIMNTDPTDSSALTLSKLAAMQVGVAKGDIT